MRRRRGRPDRRWIAAVGLMTLAAAGAWLARSDPARVRGGTDREARRAALALAAGGRGVEAEAVLRPLLLGSDAPDAEAAEALTTIYRASFHLDAALGAADRWARDAPGDPRPWLARADLRSRRGDDPAALLGDYREALARDPARPDARLGLAEALRLAGRPDEAADAFAAYLALRPGDPAGHRGEGLAALGLGDATRAEAALDRALSLDPDDLESLVARAGIATRSGDLDGALRRLDRAVALDPFHTPARHARVLVLARLGRSDEARAERLLSDRARRDDERMEEIRAGLVRSPGDRRLMIEAARWLFDHNHADPAATWALRVAREHPGDPDACRLLAGHHDRRGEPGLANYYRAQIR